MRDLTAPERAALNVRCPACGAAPQESCRSGIKLYQTFPIHVPHAKRVRAAKPLKPWWVYAIGLAACVAILWALGNRALNAALEDQYEEACFGVYPPHEALITESCDHDRRRWIAPQDLSPEEAADNLRGPTDTP